MLYVLDPDGCYVAADDDEIILEANRVYDKCFKRGAKIESPENAEEAIKLKLVHYPYEVFACLFLDNRHCILGFEEIFRGTIDSAAVHPREIVREALNYNAAAVIFAHNHPSGDPEPSKADIAITKRLKTALDVFDIRVLDHFVVGERIVSLLARNLI